MIPLRVSNDVSLKELPAPRRESGTVTSIPQQRERFFFLLKFYFNVGINA